MTAPSLPNKNELATKIDVEVCLDNLESLPIAIAAGANRIELCSSLALGGLTPSIGMMRYAAQTATIPVYAMIRPRQGDFLYGSADLTSMQFDIDAAAEAGLQGIVLGLLNRDGEIDGERLRPLVHQAQQHGLGITFHRAFDQCRDPLQALESIIELGCERILTSGTHSNALEGCEMLQQLIQQAAGRIAIMAGAGINAHNVREIVTRTGVRQIHLSGKSQRHSQMQWIAERAKMGAADQQDFQIPVTSYDLIAEVRQILDSIHSFEGDE